MKVWEIIILIWSSRTTTNQTITSARRQKSLLSNTLYKYLNLSRLLVVECLGGSLHQYNVCCYFQKKLLGSIYRLHFQPWLVAAVCSWFCSWVCSIISSWVHYRVRSTISWVRSWVFSPVISVVRSWVCSLTWLPSSARRHYQWTFLLSQIKFILSLC